MTAKIKAGIVGARGIVGTELYEILARHPNVKVQFVSTSGMKNDKPNPLIGTSFIAGNPQFAHLKDINYSSEDDLLKLAAQCDVLFMAGKSPRDDFKWVPQLNDKCKIITIGGAYRLQNTEDFAKFYPKDAPHTDPEGLSRAVYGLPELGNLRSKIGAARLIANPGCYATAATLGVAPISGQVEISASIVAISGKTGGGNTPSDVGMFVNANENVRAYNLSGAHQHVPEIKQNLGMTCLSFTPVGASYDRGIMAICYIDNPFGESSGRILDAYASYYSKDIFVNFMGKKIPEVKACANTNRVDIGVDLDEETDIITAVCCLDNLQKGAAGAGVQNMNLMFGFDEAAGLYGARKVR